MAKADITYTMHRLESAMSGLAEVRHSLAIALDDALDVMNEQIVALEAGLTSARGEPRSRLRELRKAAAGRR